ncbi:MAG: type II secretion system F family protein [Thermoleophilia bacterium]|nr:type II secretion system F family protein [Thermoleophilia bacterium]MDQ3859511.1 type II secretion system F family protein [Actinomycetota bacterium]
MLLLFLALASLALAVYLVGEVATLPARQRQGSIRRAANYGRSPRSLNPFAANASFRERALAPAGTALARAVLRVSPKATVDSINLKLLAAGLGRTLAPTAYLAGKAITAAGGVLFGALVAAAGQGASPKGLLITLGLGLMGFFVPDTFVTFKARSRRERIQAELPDALDLLAVSVEAGLGFDGAITKLTENMHGPLADEFALTLGEMRIGESRSEALKKLSERVGVPEMAAFTRAVVQADQLGISLGRILRIQATEARNRRQAAAEERAMKAPIKMLFPTVVFIFPAMFIVILGPAFLNLARLF